MKEEIRAFNHHRRKIAEAAVFVENSVDKHFGVIIVITNCRSKELTTKVMLDGEGIFFELEFYIIRNFTERTLTHSHHHVTLLRHDFCRYQVELIQ